MSKQDRREAIRKAVPQALTPMKAIREKCIDYMCGSVREVERCQIRDCSLWPYRFGFNPYVEPRHAPQLTEQQKVANAARLRELAAKRREERERDL